MDFAAVRHNMVENQLRTNRVIDPLVVEAMEAVPRERFVPKQMRGIAYVDEDIDLGGGRFLMEPLVLGRLLQSAEIRPTDVVLDVGCATGYATAVIARMASTVVALESDPEAAAGAAAVLEELGVVNAAVVTGPLAEGYSTQGPYDVIVIEGQVPEVPPGLCAQLADGGRLVAVICDDDTGVGRLTVVTRAGNTYGRRALFDGSTRRLAGFEKRPGFVF
ncbi:MAG: protein-L-isoaspartate O-methyltransferase [Alphaproteobacteria bacterium]|nr:protein-L-isoaspartate O-methyltransferase [Alphaproteobacteria bacterium]